MNRKFVALVCLLLTLLVTNTTGSHADPTPTSTINAAFQLGYALESPRIAVLKLDQAIVNGGKTFSDSGNLADETRKTELTNYHNVVTMLKHLGAPRNVIQPYLNATDDLSHPLEITYDARQNAPDSMHLQRVWSTLDEADFSSPRDSGIMTSWLKLSHGKDALWALHLGAISSALQSSLIDPPSKMPLLNTVSTLYSTAPASAPKPLMIALGAVSDQIDKNTLTVASLQDLESAISQVFPQQEE